MGLSVYFLGLTSPPPPKNKTFQPQSATKPCFIVKISKQPPLRTHRHFLGISYCSLLSVPWAFFLGLEGHLNCRPVWIILDLKVPLGVDLAAYKAVTGWLADNSPPPLLGIAL